MKRRIKVFNYALVPDQGRFNVIRITGRTYIRKENGKTEEVKETIGYGFKFDKAILRIIDELLEKEIGDGKIETLHGYVTEYRKLKDEIDKMVNMERHGVHN